MSRSEERKIVIDASADNTFKLATHFRMDSRDKCYDIVADKDIVFDGPVNTRIQILIPEKMSCRLTTIGGHNKELSTGTITFTRHGLVKKGEEIATLHIGYQPHTVLERKTSTRRPRLVLSDVM